MTSTRWTKESIAEDIRQLAEQGVDLSYSNVVIQHLPLMRAAMRYYGSWRDAVKAAGIDYDKVRKYRSWNRQRIIERIRELYEQGEDLSWRNVSTNLDPQLAAAATKPKHFGSWRKAIEAAGIDYQEVRRYHQWDEEAIIQQIRELHEQGVPLNAKHVEEIDIPLITAARRRFETWDKALQAAGLDYKQIVLRRPFRRHQRSAQEPDEPGLGNDNSDNE
jgi:phosphoribulokinase